MRLRFFFIVPLFFFNLNFGQNLNHDHILNELRYKQLVYPDSIKSSFTIKPNFELEKEFLNYYSTKNNSSNNSFNLRILPLDLITTYSSNHPYNYNYGTLIPTRGIQSLVSMGFNFNLGPIEITFKPEYLYSNNQEYEGFWRGHYDKIIQIRQDFWNHIDLPERFGLNDFKKIYFGQSSFKIKFSNLKLALSNENLWWGPSMKNSIMLSNNALAFPHISFSNLNPLSTKFGLIEWQFVTGKLFPSKFLPSYSDYLYANFPTHNNKENRWRYFQGLILTLSPKFIDGLSIGFIRWTQSYGDFTEDNNDYFPIFDNLFRKNDKFGFGSDSLETLRDQAAGIFFRWLFKDSSMEIYGELNYNDSKLNFRDLLTDNDHSSAFSLGFSKVFNKETNKNFQISWEYTQLEQTASRLLRDAGSWYTHNNILHGYTNRGEVLGAAIGPGSNSHFISIKKRFNKNIFSISAEFIDQQNDFLMNAFTNSKDFRRYWKDYNFHLGFQTELKKFIIYAKAIYSRSINYNWGLDQTNEGVGIDYYLTGVDKNNFHSLLKITYLLGN